MPASAPVRLADVDSRTAPRAKRIFGHPLIRLVIEFVGVVAALVIVSIATKPLAALSGPGGRLGRVAATLAIVVAACAAYAGLVRLLERHRPADLTARGALPELALGAAVGGFLFSAVIGTLWLLGVYHVTGSGELGALGGALAMSVTSGCTEELIFRGVVFRNLEDLLGTWFALGISAATFGLIHISNPHSSLWAATAIAIEAGILLAACYVLTRRLWMVMGIHFAWNLTQGGVFGVAVSGGRSSGLLTSTLSGPALLSGGEFGAEASVIAVLFCLAAGVAFAWRAHARGHFVAPCWRRRPASDSGGSVS